MPISASGVGLRVENERLLQGQSPFLIAGQERLIEVADLAIDHAQGVFRADPFIIAEMSVALSDDAGSTRKT